MKKIQLLKPIIILGMVLFMISCGQKRDTKENFGKYALDLLLSEKPAQDIYLMPKDSVFTKDTLSIDKVKFLKDTPKYASYIDKQENEIKDWRKKAIELNLKNRQVKFLRTELDTVESNSSNRKDLTVYFSLDKEEHFFVLEGVDSLTNNWATYSLTIPTNKEEQEKLKLEKRKATALAPYIPFGVYFTGYNWEHQDAKPKTFVSFQATIKNSSKHTFKKLKFRAKIYKGEGSERIEVFNRVIEKKVTIYANDELQFEIDELRNFYAGINITDKNNFSWEAELIDAKPRPGYGDLPY